MCEKLTVLEILGTLLMVLVHSTDSSVDPTECRFTKLGSSYTGTLSVTKNGHSCQRWDSYTPHSHPVFQGAHFPYNNVSRASNYCRNPGGMRPKGVWCYTTDSGVEWEYCDVPMCECSTLKAGWLYAGQTSVTTTGRTCQRWSAQHPHGHTYVEDNMYPDDTVADASNYCRNPAQYWEGGIWCYTTDSNVRWQHCNIPMCNCLNNDDAQDFLGRHNRTVSGLSCQAWSSQYPHPHQYTDPSMYPDDTIQAAGNACRNPDYSKTGPWCYTVESSVEWEYCNIAHCEHSTALVPSLTTSTTLSASTVTTPPPTPVVVVVNENVGSVYQDCKFSNMGTSFRGHLSQTSQGRQCQRWNQQSPHAHSFTDERRFPDDSLTDAQNYCRNPSRQQRGPWCLTSDPEIAWEYCNVPACDCLLTERGVEYIGHRTVTRLGYTCQRWDSQTPHQHPRTQDHYYADGNITAAANYCRNPTNSGNRPFCYTTDPNRRWDYCDIPMCECSPDAEGLNYEGNINVTADGIACQRWDSQSPHQHSYYDDSMFPDGSVTAAANYCRNPDDQETGGPWCYTTDPNTRWQYCDVPLCEIPIPASTTSSTSTTPRSTLSTPTTTSTTQRTTPTTTVTSTTSTTVTTTTTASTTTTTTPATTTRSVIKIRPPPPRDENDSRDPFKRKDPSSAQSVDFDGASRNVTAIIGAVIGSLVVAMAVLAAIFLYIKFLRQSNNKEIPTQKLHNESEPGKDRIAYDNPVYGDAAHFKKGGQVTFANGAMADVDPKVNLQSHDNNSESKA